MISSSKDSESSREIQDENASPLDEPSPTSASRQHPKDTASTGRTPFSNSDESFGAYNEPSTLASDSNYLEVPQSIATELVRIYFEKIQPWLPLLHRPGFYSRYMTDENSQFAVTSLYSPEDTLILYSMFALAAHHSSNPYFQDVRTAERGKELIKMAKQSYKQLRETADGASLPYLQGCALLAAYMYTSGPSHQAWVLTGICVRLAYDLDLCDMDDEPEEYKDADEWARLEEKRRAFWVVWELDTFGSTLSNRPCAISRSNMAVQLPVSDEAWFANQPVQSSKLDPLPAKAWKSLTDCDNQSERAWFIIANFLMARVFDPHMRRASSRDSEHDELSGSITCFYLSMTARFGIEMTPLFFDNSSFARCNWVIGAHILVNAARAGLADHHESHGMKMQAYSRERDRIIHHWHPEYIALSHPFLICALLPTWTPHEPLSGTETQLSEDLEKLVFERYASLWGLGSMMIGKIDAYTTRSIA
ncbi:hypothetical protein CCHR01_00323 [Colletotrichum chrysophilum]|uniref:Xylanolytic transcriptional activator regulatory domain-containing protein n=1 Tax=Colletotrichum chrysophilum TaxID=1836956 RepID=A0AAD9EQ47_9PEZI|nr:hypothetical protein CCHR01_00323 [Colletotrichum chrysophilum]